MLERGIKGLITCRDAANAPSVLSSSDRLSDTAGQTTDSANVADASISLPFPHELPSLLRFLSTGASSTRPCFIKGRMVTERGA
jgi:hypothetical protein